MAYPKGAPKPAGSGIKKGQKQYKTLAKEEARKVFEEKHWALWDKITDVQAKRALKNDRAREYSINQILGKPKESLEIPGVKKILIDF